MDKRCWLKLAKNPENMYEKAYYSYLFSLDFKI